MGRAEERRMSKREELTDLLHTELYNIYCYNCKNSGQEEPCDWCHRKYMQWQASDGLIESIIKIAERKEE